MPDDLAAANRDLSALRINRDPDRPRGGRAALLVGGLIALVAGGVIVYRALGGAARAAVVETATVRRVAASEGSALLSAGGYILPERKASVSSKTFGRLEWLGVDVGSRVKKDELIARLANADIAARVEEAKAAVADAEREYARWKALVEEGSAARERFDQADTTVKLVRARLKSVEADLEYTLIRAPFEGLVVRKNAEVGETVGPAASGGTGSTGTSICVIVDPASLEMVADVNEANIAKVRVGQQAEVVADALPERKYRGEVRQIVPTADRQKGIVQVKVRILDLDDRLLQEMAARATFLREGAVATNQRRVIAPRAAVRERGGRKVAFVVEGTRARMVGVETGVEGEDGVEITQGLAGGETVVVGGDAVEDGAEVRVVEKK